MGAKIQILSIPFFYYIWKNFLLMKKIFVKLAFLGVLSPSLYYAQTSETSPQQEKQALPKPYREEDNAEIEIQKLVKLAQKENKNIIIQRIKEDELEKNR